MWDHVLMTFSQGQNQGNMQTRMLTFNLVHLNKRHIIYISLHFEKETIVKWPFKGQGHKDQQ